MKIRLYFKTPNVVDCAIDELYEDRQSDDEDDEDDDDDDDDEEIESVRKFRNGNGHGCSGR